MNIESTLISQPAEQNQPAIPPASKPISRIKEYWDSMTPEQRSQIARDRYAKAKANKLAKAQRAEKKAKRAEEKARKPQAYPITEAAAMRSAPGYGVNVPFYQRNLKNLRSILKQVLVLTDFTEIDEAGAREMLNSAQILLFRILNDSSRIYDLHEAAHKVNGIVAE